MDRIGEQTDIEVQFYVVEHRWLSDPRVSLTKEIFRTLSEAGHRRALVAIFHPDSSTWRLSLVTMTLDIDNHGKLTREYSNARRYSFLLWENEKVKTPTDSLLKWEAVDSFDNLMERFSVEVVRKKFFDQYVDLFVQLYIAVSNDTWLVRILQDGSVDQVKFTKNLLWKIIFIYFIQKKWWLGLGRDEKWGQGDKNFMRSLWERFASWDIFVRPSTGNFYNDYLEHLFYNGFNKDRRDDEAYEPNMRMKVPYLNGGLFKEDYRDWEHFDAKISNDIFSNTKNTGILDIFDIYNFTIDEDDLFDSEIAVDPEMLWKIFEKMISVSRDNISEIVALYSGKWKVEINTELNKKFGAYYTPREIVHYITRESIVAYLVNWLSGNREENESKVRFMIYSKDRHLSKKWDIENESELELLLSVSEEIDILLQKMKILDPAVGSWAFPMGILHEISTLRYYLHSEGFCMTHHHEDEEQTEDLTSEGHISMYRIKRDTIKNSIYWVDIEPGAIDIARLRFWLSLVVDAETPEPLPNFEFKFVSANTLIPLMEDKKVVQTTLDIGNNELNIKTLKRYMRDYYNADSKVLKKQLEDRITNYVRLDGAVDSNQLALDSLNSGRRVQLSEFRPFDSNHSNPFFDPSLMLGEWRGFDIIIGNPPYNGISTNKGKWIMDEIEKYKYVWEDHFNERKHWLWDDYVKFIRLAETFIESKKTGILSYIVNHGFIDNPTFRGMRWHLLKTFDYIYVIDLHGNVKKKEVALDGSKDENVFDIQQGTAIFIWVRTGKKRAWELAKISHIDLYWKKIEKFEWLVKNNNESLPLATPINPHFLFAPTDFSNKSEFQNWFSINDIFPLNVTWIQTSRDDLVVWNSKKELLDRMQLFFDISKSDNDIRNIFFPWKKVAKYLPGDSRQWNLSIARKELLEENHYENIKNIAYRPFDIRYVYYHRWMIDWHRWAIMKNFTRKNLGIILWRQWQATWDWDWNLVYISNTISDLNIFYRWGGVNFPLFLYSDVDWGSIPNIDPTIFSKITEVTKVSTPEQILFYIYAILHSQIYREKFCEFLKIEFPRIPYPTSREQFLALAKLGEELSWLHLLESDKVSEHITRFPIEGLNIVETPKYGEEKVYINKSQYFSGVPESVWNFPIGGYLPAQKWLKDRKGRNLSEEDIAHYQSMIVAMSETIRIMKEIDIVYSGADNL